MLFSPTDTFSSHSRRTYGASKLPSDAPTWHERNLEPTNKSTTHHRVVSVFPERRWFIASWSEKPKRAFLCDVSLSHCGDRWCCLTLLSIRSLSNETNGNYLQITTCLKQSMFISFVKFGSSLEAQSFCPNGSNFVAAFPHFLGLSFSPHASDLPKTIL